MTQWGLDNLFNPGKRHMDDEKRRLQSTREEVGDNSGGRRIDLEAGKVSISVPRRTATSGDRIDTDEPVDLDPALDAEDEPAVALANDETQIEPVPVDEADADAEADSVVADAPLPEPEPVSPKRRTVSANAWSRRG